MEGFPGNSSEMFCLILKTRQSRPQSSLQQSPRIKIYTNPAKGLKYIEPFLRFYIHKLLICFTQNTGTVPVVTTILIRFHFKQIRIQQAR